MELLNQLFLNSQIPLFSAFLLGLMTAISPCPLATNITAVGFISKDLTSKKRVFYNGLIYTLGRSITYVVLGVILILGAEQIKLSRELSVWGERLLGPVMIVIGLFMIGLFSFNLPGLGALTERVQTLYKDTFWGVLLLGIVFALAFCPYSGVLYFGALIPMSVGSGQGFLMLTVFAIATGVPVIIFSWVIAFAVNRVGSLYNNIRLFEKWFRKAIAVVFLVVGGFYTWSFYF